MNSKLHRKFQLAGRSFVGDASIKDPRVGIYEMPGCRFVGAFGPDSPDAASDDSGSWRNLDVNIDLALLRQLEPIAQQMVKHHARLRTYWRQHGRHAA